MREDPSPSRAVCPTCGDPVTAPRPADPDTQGSERLPASHLPFCSRRCQLLDLGRWFNGEYAVAGEPAVAVEGLEGFDVPDGFDPFRLPESDGGWLDERDA